MTVQPILQGEIPELRVSCTEVSKFNQKLAQMLDNLADTMRANHGVGLAAPQIGIHERAIVIDIGHGIMELVNPKIMEAKGTQNEYESCLSFPGVTLRVPRPRQVAVKAQDRYGNETTLLASDLLARVLCHEIDHLDGILFMDRLSDEEVFMQLLGRSDILAEEDEGLDVDFSVSVGESTRHAESAARMEELQMAVDMMADVSWKLTLAIELLKEESTLFGDAVDWNALTKVPEFIENVYTVLEEELKKPK